LLNTTADACRKASLLLRPSQTCIWCELLQGGLTERLLAANQNKEPESVNSSRLPLPGIRFAFLRAEDALVAGALLPRAFCPRWRWLTDKLYQPEAHCVSASIASGEPITRTYKNVVRLPMSAVHHLINAALAAECTRKKIVSGTGVFHKESPAWNLPPGKVACGRIAASARLDAGRASSVARSASLGGLARDRRTRSSSDDLQEES
jgi:hypothetical protein